MVATWRGGTPGSHPGTEGAYLGVGEPVQFGAAQERASAVRNHFDHTRMRSQTLSCVESLSAKFRGNSLLSASRR